MDADVSGDAAALVDPPLPGVEVPLSTRGNIGKDDLVLRAWPGGVEPAF